jgi:uncharacterized protein (TIGR03000 family)
MRHTKRLCISLCTLLILSAPSIVQAQVVALPLFGGFGFGAFGPGYWGNPYGGYRWFNGGAGMAPYVFTPGRNMALYNGAFRPDPYNPTPAIYNPAQYNASFNPNMGRLVPDYTANVAAKASPTPSSSARVPAGKGIRPASLAAPARPARLEVRLPAADAEVMLQGVRMKQTGTIRRFVTPPLDLASRFSYDVVVRWRDARGSHTETRHVRVMAGQDLIVDLTDGER